MTKKKVNTKKKTPKELAPPVRGARLDEVYEYALAKYSNQDAAISYLRGWIKGGDNKK